MTGRGEPGVAGVADVTAPAPGAEPVQAISFEVLTDPAGVPRARAMLQRA